MKRQDMDLFSDIMSLKSSTSDEEDAEVPNSPTSDCSVCCEVVSNVTRHAIDTHCNTHSTSNFIFCNYCNFRSRKNTAVIQHLNEFHVLLEPRQCDKCLTLLNNFQEYVTHVNSHKTTDINGNNSKLINTKFCDISSLTKASKPYNKITKSNTRHNCQLCSHRYVHLKNLQKHYENVHGLQYTTKKLPIRVGKISVN